MDSNTHSTSGLGGGSIGLPDRQPVKAPVGQPDELAALTADVDELTALTAGLDDLAALAADLDALAAGDLDSLSEVVRAERVLVLQRWLDGLEGQWRKDWPGWMPRGGRG